MEQEYSEIILDWPEALHRAVDDVDLLEELLADLLEMAPQSMDKIRAAAFDKDFDALERAAHSIKGAARNLSAKNFAWYAYQLELMGSGCTLEGYEDVLAHCLESLDQLNAYIALRSWVQ